MTVLKEKPKIVMIFPITDSRINSIAGVLAGEPIAERYLFYGLDYLIGRGVDCQHNITSLKPKKFYLVLINLFKELCKKLTTIPGEPLWLYPCYNLLKSKALFVIFSEHTIFPILYLRAIHLLPRRPTILFSVGLPEKLAIAKIQRPIVTQYILNELRKIETILSFSKVECEILKNDFKLPNVKFINLGVDFNYFAPIESASEIDVLSIGADSNRDFETLINVANSLPTVAFRIITTKHLAKKQCIFLPPNVDIMIDIPMGMIKSQISKAKIIALPVLPNSYSGATTVVLQAMAMQKPVIANEIGANKFEYDFDHEKSILFVPTQNCDALCSAVTLLLSNPSYMSYLGSNARKLIISKLGLNSFVEKLYVLYTEVYNKYY